MDILQNLGAAMVLIMDPEVILFMVLGTAIGIAIGALPGLSATMGIAVLIPLTFVMQPLSALGMIAGIYNGAMYGGAIPAILLRIPGTPAGIATVFDGYPMAQQGQARTALNISLASSSLGSVASALSLLLLAPPLALVSLSFGPSEYFWLAVFGLTSIAVLLSDNPIKGLLSACLGLWVGTMGIDRITGNERFTFEQVELLDGINIIVLLTGLYAIPPALELAEKALVIHRDQLSVSTKTERFRWSSLIPTWIRSSLIGIVIGIIPAVGGNVAALLAWNEVRRVSKDPSRFGKGAPEGVAAAECANNADNAATLIPALTLGIPGNAVSAVILGALLVHGLRPGPQLFRDDAPVIYGFMLAMLITGVLMFVIGRFGAKLFVNVLRLPALLLAPMIVGLTVVGVYSINNTMFDVWLMLGFGLLGYAMDKMAIPSAPAVLAVILGPMAEAEFRRSLLISRGDVGFLFERPISMVLIGMVVLVLMVPLYRRWKGRSAERAEP